MEKWVELKGREKRHSRIRRKIIGTKERPRLSVRRSTNHLYAQIIDDTKGNTLASFDSRELKNKTPGDRAKEVGLGIAKKAIAAKIKKVVFDRGGYLYTGKITLVADGAREGGLEF